MAYWQAVPLDVVCLEQGPPAVALRERALWKRGLAWGNWPRMEATRLEAARLAAECPEREPAGGGHPWVARSVASCREAEWLQVVHPEVAPQDLPRWVLAVCPQEGVQQTVQV